MSILWLIGGLVVLIAGGELLVQNASALALKANIPPLVVGLTVVAMGTSAPELFASLQAAWQGDGSIAIGNVLGSNVANLGLALGVTALVAPVVVAWKALKVHWWVMIAATASFMFMVQDLRLTGLEGAMLLAGGALYLGGQIGVAKQDQVDDLMEEAGDATKPYPMLVAMLVMGCVGLFFGSEAFVRGAAELALSMGISNHAVGVTVVAFGTSVPEIAASLTAALKGNNELSIGNLVGSNILNILLVLGATASWGTLKVDPVVPVHDMWWMLGAAALLAPLVWLGKGVVSRWGAALYILIYGVYVALVLMHCN
jgi:cation:H+ antiporter